MVQPVPNPANPARLITIPISHYCEKTRWALTRLQIPFVEESHMPPFHRFATRKIGKPATADSMTETERNLSAFNRFVVQKVGGQSVPVLIAGTTILRSSDEILSYLDARSPDRLKLYPTSPELRKQVDELVNLFDTVLAPKVRQWAYAYLMDCPNLVQPLWCQGVPWFERILFPVMYPWMRTNVLQMYDINEATAIAAHASVLEIFDRVGSLLADGRLYLVGDRFSAADLTFATLAAAVVSPAGYGVKLPELTQLPDRMAQSIRGFRETMAGKFVLRLYQEYARDVQKIAN